MTSSGTALGYDNHRRQEADPDGARDDADPFRGMKKPILSMVGQTEHEVAHEAARRQQDDPASPFHAAVIDHAIEDEQEPEPRVSQRRREGRRVDQVLERDFLKEAAIQVPEQAGDSDRDRAAAHKQPDDAAEPSPPGRQTGS